jgi:hypothetical protein
MTESERTPDPDGLERFSERDAQIWTDRTRYSMSTLAIARKHGISQQRVSQILAAIRESIPVDVREQAVMEADAAYRELIADAMRIMDMLPPPVTAGKDGKILIDPVTKEVVRDHAGRLRAIETVARLLEHRRRLFGLDAPTKLDVHTNTEQGAADKAAKEAAARLESPEEGTEA